MRRVFSPMLRMLVAAALLVYASAAGAAEPALANGVFLVAKPELSDPNFHETVILITEPVAGGGPLGVIVNRPLAAKLSEVAPNAPRLPEQYDQIYAGGPVARNQILFLLRTHERPQPSLPVLADVYLSGDVKLLERIVSGEVKVEAFRAYAGFAGWAPGQLQNELSRNDWYLINADADTIFSAEPARIWPEMVKRASTHSTRYDAAVEARAAMLWRAR